ECPNGYELYRGQCYKLIPSDGNLLNSLETCNQDGAALAFPESLDVLQYLATMLE
ncbi:hypothetical protein SK128_009090, partial [Halocaridina rubra]